MRLHRLSVTAFGPFVETAEVDFDALSDAGLFLLSGATGAGKSSVLDAVCFALYGAVPGDRNDAGRLRSDQAPPGSRPEVVLEATLSGRRFRVVRSPAWDRPKKRGTGTTREQATRDAQRAASTASGAADQPARRGRRPGLGPARDEPRPVLPGRDAARRASSRPSCAPSSDERHRCSQRLFRTGRFERVEAWLRDHRLDAPPRVRDPPRERVADLVSRLSEAADGRVPDGGRATCRPQRPTTLLAAWARRSCDGAASRRCDRDRRGRVRGGRPRRPRPPRTPAASSRPPGTRGSSTRPPRSSGSTERDDDHAARAARSTPRVGRGSVPLAGWSTSAREACAGGTSAAAEAARWRGRALPGSTRRSLSRELDRLADELADRSPRCSPPSSCLDDLRGEQAAPTRSSIALRRDDELARAERHARWPRCTRLADGGPRPRPRPRLRCPASEAELERLRRQRQSPCRRRPADARARAGDRPTTAARPSPPLLDLREALLDLRERRIAGMAAELAGALAVGDDCPVCGSADHPRPAVRAAGHPDAEAEREAQRAVDDAQAVEQARGLRVRDVATALAAARTTAGGWRPLRPSRTQLPRPRRSLARLQRPRRPRACRAAPHRRGVAADASELGGGGLRTSRSGPPS